jgi:hypothetical protein
VERENAFFKSSPVDEYHLPQMNSEKVFLDVVSLEKLLFIRVLMFLDFDVLFFVCISFVILYPHI